MSGFAEETMTKLVLADLPVGPSLQVVSTGVTRFGRPIGVA